MNLQLSHHLTAGTLLFGALVGATGLGAAARATSFYVDNAAAGSGNGLAWGSAWQSFARINWGAVRPGDTIFISGGTAGKTYRETLTVGASGTASAAITITRGRDPGHEGAVVIDGQNSRSSGVTLSGRNYVTVRGLAPRNHPGAGIVVKTASAGVVIEDNEIYSGDPGGGNARGIDARNNVGANAMIVRRNRFTTPTSSRAQTDGVWSSGNDGVVFENNRIVIANADTTGHSDGIQSYLDRNITIRGNWIEQANTARANNHGLWLSDTRSGGVIKVYNNVVLTPNLTDDSAVTHWAEPSWNENGTIRLWNNTIIGGRRSLNLYKSPNAQAWNNIIWPAAGGYGFYIVDGTIPAANIDRNLIWTPGATVAYVGSSALSWTAWRARGYDRNGLNTDPAFNNLAAKDYSLRSTSPPLNRGATLSEVKVDYAGLSRPQGASYDIGALERPSGS